MHGPQRTACLAKGAQITDNTTFTHPYRQDLAADDEMNSNTTSTSSRNNIAIN